jgi:pimeloyl-ACP methyl ester carboxylesterase
VTGISDPIAPVAAVFSKTYQKVDDGIELRVLRWQPQQPRSPVILVLVAGWISVVEGWQEVLRELAPDVEIVYIETREKHTARIAGAQMQVPSFSIPRLADDLITIFADLGIDPERAVLSGSSMGANVILEALKHQRLPVSAAFLIGPNIEFRIPWWSPVLIGLPNFTYHAAKHAALWYLRSFRVNARDDPAQMRRYERTVNAAEPTRLKLSVKAVADYQVWPDLDTIRTPVALAYAPSDTLHGEGEVEAIAARIPGARAIACPSNTYMHTAEVVGDIRRYLEELGIVI